MGRVFDFDSALVRTPAPSVTDGLRAGDHDGPSFEGVLAEHRAYVAALEAAGLAVEVLPPLPEFPDSVFVEDPAFVVPEGCILLTSKAESRAGEEVELAEALRQRFGVAAELGEGDVDGGDVLILPQEIIVGLTARTDPTGARQFVAWAERHGRRARIVETPPGLLHLKSGCSLVDEETVLAVPQLRDAAFFNNLEVIVTPPGEDAAANALRVNDSLLVSAAYPQTIDLLSSRYLRVVPLQTSEIEKLDAGLSCMSLRWKSR